MTVEYAHTDGSICTQGASCIQTAHRLINHESVSDTVAEVILGREDVYGEPINGMVRIAQIWSGIIDAPVQPADVPLMLIGLKLVRAHQAPDYADNSDDIEGYLDIFRKVVGEEMISARTVADYLDQKNGRAR